MSKRYPMCKDQPAQIDCRNIECKFHQDSKCINVSPALTLTGSGNSMHVTCWSFEQKADTSITDIIQAEKQKQDDTILVKVPEVVYQSWWDVALTMVQKHALMEEKQERIRTLLFAWVEKNYPGYSIVAFEDFDIREASEFSVKTGYHFSWGMYVVLQKGAVTSLAGFEHMILVEGKNINGL